MDRKHFKQKLLNELYKNYHQCTRCPLVQGRHHIVFGEGNPDAKLMFIGEGPGRDEDIQGCPFVGRAGKLLNEVLQAVNLKREDVFITNIVKCRPPNNRTPLPAEISLCKPLLVNQIKIIRPQIICTLGSCATKALLAQDVKISQIRGKIIEKEKIAILPTFHPAYILRNQKELSKFFDDILLAAEYIKPKS